MDWSGHSFATSWVFVVAFSFLKLSLNDSQGGTCSCCVRLCLLVIAHRWLLTGLSSTKAPSAETTSTSWTCWWLAFLSSPLGSSESAIFTWENLASGARGQKSKTRWLLFDMLLILIASSCCTVAASGDLPFLLLPFRALRSPLSAHTE